MLEDPVYREQLRERLFAGILPAALEQRLWDYYYGKPTDRQEVSVTDIRIKYAEMDETELAERAAEMAGLAQLLKKKEEQDSAKLN
jgi:hypothetical protein